WRQLPHDLAAPEEFRKRSVGAAPGFLQGVSHRRIELPDDSRLYHYLQCHGQRVSHCARFDPGKPDVTGPSPMIAVTGATGYLGSALVQHLLSRGHGVVALVRPGRAIEVPRHPRLRAVEYALGRELPIEAWKGCVAGVHAAYDFSPTDWAEIQRVNVDGSVTLF